MPTAPLAGPFRVAPWVGLGEKGDLVYVGQVRFQISTLSDAAHDAVERAQGSRPAGPIRLWNAYCVALAERDPHYRALQDGGITYPDGAPVAWFMRRKGARHARRVRGPSFFEEVIRSGIDSGVRHFFLGTTSTTLVSLRQAIEHKYPDARVVGMYAPPFAPIDDAFIGDCVREVQAASPDIVWVGLGTPKQDFVCAGVSQRTGLTTVGVGAAFDFVAGVTKSAPRWMQDSGLEWLFRLLSEPRRLLRRYLVGNLQFVAAALRHWNKGITHDSC